MNKNLSSSLVIATIVSAALLTGCAGGTVKKSEMTAVLGAIVGSEIGKEFGGGSGKRVTRILGAALGGFIGASLGRPLDNNDQRNVYQAMNSAPDNSQVNWRNNQSGAQYAITPTSTYQQTINQAPTQCRNYTMTVNMGGSPEFVNGRACMVNGEWVKA